MASFCNGVFFTYVCSALNRHGHWGEKNTVQSGGSNQVYLSSIINVTPIVICQNQTRVYSAQPPPPPLSAHVCPSFLPSALASRPISPVINSGGFLRFSAPSSLSSLLSIAGRDGGGEGGGGGEGEEVSMPSFFFFLRVGGEGLRLEGEKKLTQPWKTNNVNFFSFPSTSLEEAKWGSY